MELKMMLARIMFGELNKNPIYGKLDPFFQIMQRPDQAIDSIDAIEKMLQNGEIAPPSKSRAAKAESAAEASQTTKSKQKGRKIQVRFFEARFDIFLSHF